METTFITGLPDGHLFLRPGDVFNRTRRGMFAPLQPGFCEEAIAPVDTTKPGLESAQTDTELVRRVTAGDTGAYGELVRRHQNMVYSIVSRITADRDDADDVAIEVFAQAFKSIASFKGKSSFSTWLYRISVNKAMRFSSNRARRNTASLDDPDMRLVDILASPEGLRPDSIMYKKESREAVRRAVAELPEKHRLAVILHYFSGLSCEQTAETLGCSVGTVWSRLHYACNKLRGRLDWLVDGND